MMSSMEPRIDDGHMGDAVEEPLYRGPTLALRRRSNPRQPFLYGALKSRLYILASQASETMGELVDFGRCDVHSAQVTPPSPPARSLAAP